MPNRTASIPALLLAAGAAWGVPAAADEPAKSNARTVFDNERITGGWFGLRDEIEGRGLIVGGEYVAEFSSVLDGGVNRRGSFRNQLTVDAEADLETLAGLPGGTLFVQYLSVNAESGGSLDAGDLCVGVAL